MSNKKSALGRGLGALLPTQSSEDEAVPAISKTKLYNFEERVRTATRISEIQIDLIDPNPFQPRTDFDVAGLEELAASIRQVGIVQPITVRSIPGGRYQLISGERRMRASLLAHLTEIPAYIREADAEAMLEMALVENVQRESLNPIEIAIGYQRLIDECGLKQDDVAVKVGKNRTTVANSLRLLKLPAPVQLALKEGTVSTGHARALLTLNKETDQIKLLASILAQGLSVRAVEERVRKWGDHKQAKGKKAPLKLVSQEDLGVRAVRDRLRNVLSTQVVIKPSSAQKGGRIEVEYYSDDDLDRIVDLITR